MATSGSSNYSQNVDEVIDNALQLLGISGMGVTVADEDINFCYSILNNMIKAWSSMGLHLWAKSEGILYLTQYTSRYELGNASTDAKVTSSEDEVMTQLNGALATSAISVTVDSTLGMTANDYIGIVLSTNNIYWTTILSIDSATTLTLTAGVSATASDNAYVFTFTNRIYKPLRILDARLVSGIDNQSSSSKIERFLAAQDYQTYMQMPAKTTNGIPTQFTYNPRLVDGNMYVWPRPIDCNYRVEFTYERMIEDLDTATDDFDFPAEWLEPLTYQLAVRIAPAFGKDVKVQKVIAPIAIDMLNNLKNWDNEIETVSFSPNVEGY